jgi:starch synthase (maltosyl-transferring)
VIGRFPIYDITPTVFFGGEFVAAKAVVNEDIPVRASITREGHDSLGAQVVLVDPTGKETSRKLMREIWPGTDRYEAIVRPQAEGVWSFYIEAFDNPFQTWKHDSGIKIAAGIDEDLCCAMGIEVFTQALSATVDKENAKLLEQAIQDLSNQKLSAQIRFERATSPEIIQYFYNNPLRRYVTKSESYNLKVERHRALFGSWYEFFPRSEGSVRNKDGSITSGNFRTAVDSLKRVAAMGFDVLYLPPIHPIGKTFRKGKNNSLTPTNEDVGVPWAIGSDEGGHDSIHPDLGTLEDFKNFIESAKKLNLEVALDFALQVSPDHPWVKSNPEWFTKRPDGSIAYAENPPKKYQDIYPINFDNDYQGIRNEVLRVLRFWISVGIKIFRVDNPHTKPTRFWQDVISDINSTNPEVIFLAEAFSRPAIMQSLGKAGFQQSYTYFTWRTSKHDLMTYGTEVAKDTSAFFRPNFWVNTPDILPFHLQTGNPNIFSLRALLASTLTPSWGMYAGYELYEHEKFKDGGEEYRDSEKYEIKVRDFNRVGKDKTLAPFISLLNKIRRENLALHWLRNLEFHHTDSEAIIAYSKRYEDNLILVVVNLDPHVSQETTVHWNMWHLGIPESEFVGTDLFTGNSVKWSPHTSVRLDPNIAPGFIIRVAL